MKVAIVAEFVRLFAVSASVARMSAATSGTTVRPYRRFAGIEPVPLPEVVIATDPQALVGADHPSRHQHGVILSN